MVAQLIEPTVSPAATPRRAAAPDRLPFEFEDDEHTPDTWAAYITAPALAEFHAIRTAAVAVAAAAAQWVKRHGGDADAGAVAIRAAGLELPDPVAEYGTTLKDAPACLRALVRKIESFDRETEGIPDPTAERNDPGRIRRILTTAGQGEGR